MSTESVIYDRIKNLASGRVYPTVSTENTQLPMIIYTVSQSKPEINLQSDSNLTVATIEIDFFSVDIDTILVLMDECKALLHCFRGNSIQGCFLQNAITNPEEYGFSGNQQYLVYITT